MEYLTTLVVMGAWMEQAGLGAGGMRAAIVAALPRLRRFCQAMAGNSVDGDDLMQATVERALSRSGQFEPGTRLDSWMFRIAQNLHIDGARAAKRRGTAVDVDALHSLAGSDGRELVEGRSQLAAAQRALQALPDDQRVVFVLVVIEGRSYRDTAEVLDLPIGTVMSRLARARGRIAEALGETRESNKDAAR
ncbi:RNA polymerase sigma factor [Novosphingobium taihuense]|uniref:RNA polymerase sigma-70 factor (ECF subfamily) n=1 Tax=Novosphingobium taihuense TaxID=260085 RepID=A0A7W7ETV6_9SPHN|nr:RNA polymerase sigma factor [Novosphingobium taihuense]MBB4613429.1 RNA polymerase sigma-70 factor (ECF subfamily) [Novosphingobium taihuense]TWH80935.1 RNA polymerase sigma-70 factor (ECF subfamily) [Novosphingobium taihuense]